jgi:Na+-translocating ferredoxin:NAD+ oxidoreductase RnfC subunit
MNLIDKIAAAGVVGCGGAGFPTGTKLSGKIGHLIINAAECEPLLRTDRYIMIHLAVRVAEAAAALRSELGDIPCTIALKEDYKEEIKSLQGAIDVVDKDIKLFKMKGFYPAGDEQTMVAEVTGKVVPPAGIPLDVGCAVSNVGTLLAIRDAMEGTPFTHKFLTVTGAVKSPTVMRVPVGTPFSECIARAGGALMEKYFVVSGGPMMGKRMEMEEALEAFVTKTTSGILVLPSDGYIASSSRISVAHMKSRAKSACIQCSQCTDLCPRNLLGHPIEPHKIMRKLAMAKDLESLLDDPDILQAALCCECGICEMYACPMQLQPRRVNALLKAELAKRGIRYPKGEGQKEMSRQRDTRKIPAKRVAARAGVLPWYAACGTEKCLQFEGNTVTLTLRQSVGMPAQPVVSNGERVALGQLIARCPDGKLGANLHASIGGIVRVNPDSIVITREGGLS